MDESRQDGPEFTRNINRIDDIVRAKLRYCDLVGSHKKITEAESIGILRFDGGRCTSANMTATPVGFGGTDLELLCGRLVMQARRHKDSISGR